MTLTPEEERILRKLLSKKKRRAPRRTVPIKKRITSKLATDLFANALLFAIVLMLLFALVTR